MQVLPLERECLTRARPASAEQLEDHLVTTFESILKTLDVRKRNSVSVPLSRRTNCSSTVAKFYPMRFLEMNRSTGELEKGRWQPPSAVAAG